ncbi:peptidoglycan-binding domain-containing protein [Streptomyces sp. NPDC005908]|uniref:peptidoglycan-binding domain-containing protein n=1 Tax=unclassified Streptomyces TaxID=2593676 RepID=UPI0033EE87A0
MTTAQGPEPPDGPALEPVRVLRPRRTDALAELFRDIERGDDEEVASPPPPEGSEEITRELPPVPAGPAPAPPRPSRLRRAAPALVVAVAALAGFGGALLFTERPRDDNAAPAAPATTAPTTGAPAPAAPPAPAEAGFLHEGDTGPEVVALQERLLRVPDVYRDGTTDGRYDTALTEAVARFQLWYGVHGDETGVYGDDTRRALETHTGGP